MGNDGCYTGMAKGNARPNPVRIFPGTSVYFSPSAYKTSAATALMLYRLV